MMYSIKCKVQGTAILLQNRYALPGAPVPGEWKQADGSNPPRDTPEYAQFECFSKLYQSKGYIYQPAEHFERAMVKAAVNWKIKGQGKKTYKDKFNAFVEIDPQLVFYKNGDGNLAVPDEFDVDPDEPLYMDYRPVVVSRARIPRARPAFKPGWELEFVININTEDIHHSLVYEVLQYAGKYVGIGDYRPKYGRFIITEWEVMERED